ncbi:class I SAM-dependent methyltransferase [Pseudovibrio ascidiaceicola]|uniref:class I SAM-dependent methyltransferase n=1 Tax=Pseudovibrio ascidiaceicola TaxID=285279 RepID=UPI00135AC5D2|nr:methyltransferase domain-containing protein [Pseudovibrio ascidiaceicola]
MQPYDEGFYDNQQDGSLASAKEVLPIVFQHLSPESVIDFGCGTGSWLLAATQLGAKEILGLDGAWVPQSSLRIPTEDFEQVDLEKPESIQTGRHFDLAMSLEVLEHLSSSAAHTILEKMAESADNVLLSVAVPEQGGIHHINEQRQSYWAKLMEEKGFFPIDIVRPAIWNNPNVSVWYKQNILLYSKTNQTAAQPISPFPLDIIHPDLYENTVADLRGRVTKLRSKQIKNRIRKVLGIKPKLPH